MGFFEKLGIESSKASIDWELKPSDTFGMFESWGGKERIRHKSERFYYFFIDNNGEKPELLLMERGIKYARVLAVIDAPRKMLNQCVKSQGKTMSIDKSYAIDDGIRKWLEDNVVETSDFSNVRILINVDNENKLDTGLPILGESLPDLGKHKLRSKADLFEIEDINSVVRAADLYDSEINPGGSYQKHLVDNGDGLVVTDLVSGLMWQREGSDINSIRTVLNWIEDLNTKRFGGYDDWRLPTIDEGLSLLEKTKNSKGLYVHHCFSAEQPFIFTSDQRKPGGYWYIDFTQARVYWASGFNPGGFGRVCRSVTN